MLASKFRLLLLLILTLAVIPSLAHATKVPPSPPPSSSTNWARAYNIPYSASPYSTSAAVSVAQTSSGGYLVGGWCYAGSFVSAKNPNCNGYATVMRVDSGGNIQSQTQYVYNNYPYTVPIGLIRPSSDGGSIFAGFARFGCPATGQFSCAVLVKVDSTGNVQWNYDLQFSTTCSSGPSTWPFDLRQTTDGGYVVVGYAYTPGCTYSPFIVKLSSAGQLQWQHTYADAKGYSSAYSVQLTSDGGYILGGDIDYYVSASYIESAILVFRLDSIGGLVWQHAYEAGTDAYFASMASTSDGGVIVGGSVDQQASSTSYTSSILLLKLDSAGNTQFATTYLPAPKDQVQGLELNAIQQTSDGGYAFAGDYFDYTIYNTRTFLVKTDTSGNVQWDKIYGPDVEYSDRKISSFQQTTDGGFILAGRTNQFNNGYYSLWLVKTDSNGNISGCSDVKSDSYTSGTVTVATSNTSISAFKNGVSYVQDPLTLYAGALTATKEC